MSGGRDGGGSYLKVVAGKGARHAHAFQHDVGAVSQSLPAGTAGGMSVSHVAWPHAVGYAHLMLQMQTCFGQKRILGLMCCMAPDRYNWCKRAHQALGWHDLGGSIQHLATIVRLPTSSWVLASACQAHGDHANPCCHT